MHSTCLHRKLVSEEHGNEYSSSTVYTGSSSRTSKHILWRTNWKQEFSFFLFFPIQSNDKRVSERNERCEANNKMQRLEYLQNCSRVQFPLHRDHFVLSIYVCVYVCCGISVPVTTTYDVLLLFRYNVSYNVFFFFVFADLLFFFAIVLPQLNNHSIDVFMPC